VSVLRWLFVSPATAIPIAIDRLKNPTNRKLCISSRRRVLSKNLTGMSFRDVFVWLHPRQNVIAELKVPERPWCDIIADAHTRITLVEHVTSTRRANLKVKYTPLPKSQLQMTANNRTNTMLTERTRLLVPVASSGEEMH
jgi:hypothetical protein